MLKLVLAVGLLAASGSLAAAQSKGYVQAGVLATEQPAHAPAAPRNA
jgi:hypothetical protein